MEELAGVCKEAVRSFQTHPPGSHQDRDRIEEITLKIQKHAGDLNCF
jgi:hypothetical protein